MSDDDVMPRSDSNARVVFVGMGPGDPDLLTFGAVAGSVAAGGVAGSVVA